MFIDKIYRGENLENGIKERVHTIRMCANRTGFPSDMINGGAVYRIEEMGLMTAVIHHVAANFQDTVKANAKKHLISFSSSRKMAEIFATHYDGGKSKNAYEIYQDYYTQNIDEDKERIWDHARHLVIEMDVSKKEKIQGITGCYKLKYANGNGQLLMVNVLSYLESFPHKTDKIKMAIEFAKNESEWSILPIDTIDGGSRSALLLNSDELTYNFYPDDRYSP